MKRIAICRCNLDVQLSPPSSSSSSSSSRESTNLHCQSMSNCSSSTDHQISIFHHKKIKPAAVCFSCDPIEIQVIDILLQARGETEKKLKYSRPHPYNTSIIQQHGLPCLGGLSLKRSIQRFLEKRRDRIHSTIPYN